ncbi:MAG TPA: squalene/phytoene synthase family protein [Gammaproteobacteria bacterium]|nr:squalene/phytoene synthase family protein [Gammaproteobacteria bacterium]
MSTPDDLALQRALLHGVSRTFALTIPVLPPKLEPVIGNAYLLCRITDTIEDHTALDPVAQAALYERFIAAVEGHGDAAAFARDFGARLTAQASDDERRLIAETPRVLAITAGFHAEQRAALAECVAVMGRGMAVFQRGKSTAGLADLAAHAHYCYVVAGCVGEMLTRLFIGYLPELAPRRAEMLRLAVSFGQCLQMTNILKDFWEDRAQGACWLPRDVFLAEGLELAAAQPGDARFARGCRRLLGLAHAHAENALRYTLLLPPRETGLRNFCLWALFMALLTQRKLLAHPGFARGAEVKITRRSVYRTVAWCKLTAGFDALLRTSFALLAHRLPPPASGDFTPVAAEPGVDSEAEALR